MPARTKTNITTDPKIKKKLADWVSQFAGNRNVVDPAIQKQITNTTYELAKNDLLPADIVKRLEIAYPALKSSKPGK
jgi:hypothetical protein